MRIVGSTVNIRCTYTYPSNVSVQETFWFTKGTYTDPVDLKTQSEYSDRVQYQCKDKTCTLTIRDLRETDSAQYQFRFITNQPGGDFTGSPGVTLTVTGNTTPNLCLTFSCSRTNQPDYIWYMNGQRKTKFDLSGYFYSKDSYSCAPKGREDFPSPLVYAPKLLSLSVSPSAEIVEGSSVTLTCSSDANPAAKYTCKQFIFSSIQSSDSGEYYCTAENDLGRRTSGSIFIHVTCESNSFFRKQHTANNTLYSQIFIFNVVKIRNQFS
uniref:Ig-like domain-containing protein n=1 Tax=Mastacembelus armatus TaxID=205130 RepID=A0A7N8WKF5_9TELE